MIHPDGTTMASMRRHYKHHHSLLLVPSAPSAAAEPKAVVVLDVPDHKAAAAVGPAAAMPNAPVVAVAACADFFAGVTGSIVAVG
jgi:hypothetical protein